MTKVDIKRFVRRHNIFSYGDGMCQLYIMNHGTPMSLLIQIPKNVRRVEKEAVAIFAVGKELVSGIYNWTAKAFICECPDSMVVTVIKSPEVRYLKDEEREVALKQIKGE